MKRQFEVYGSTHLTFACVTHHRSAFCGSFASYEQSPCLPWRRGLLGPFRGFRDFRDQLRVALGPSREGFWTLLGLKNPCRFEAALATTLVFALAHLTHTLLETTPLCAAALKYAALRCPAELLWSLNAALLCATLRCSALLVGSALCSSSALL